MTTKILVLTDALGNLVRFVLMPGHRYDTVGIAPLIDGLAFQGFIADKAFNSNSIIAVLNERGAKIVILQHPRRASPLPIDADTRPQSRPHRECRRRNDRNDAALPRPALLGGPRDEIEKARSRQAAREFSLLTTANDLKSKNAVEVDGAACRGS